MNNDIDKVLHSIHPDYRKCERCGEYFNFKDLSSITSNNLYYISSNHALCKDCFGKFLSHLEGKDNDS